MDHGDGSRDFISVAEAARILKRSTEQVRRYLREGQLPGQRMGGQWFIDRASVASFGSTRTREEKFTSTLKPAARTRPLDDVIGIGNGPGTNISNGKLAYRAASLRER
ncbi:MAG TPA: helix-turn-helix domain-containing protein [Thermomicrobiales bacterium]|nr:helix-turn-helix domain-containing protein [Thermomicrobiales bacterium]